MARIKIKNLPRNTKIGRQELKRVLGGMVSGIENNIQDAVQTQTSGASAETMQAGRYTGEDIIVNVSQSRRNAACQSERRGPFHAR